MVSVSTTTATFIDGALYSFVIVVGVLLLTIYSLLIKLLLRGGAIFYLSVVAIAVDVDVNLNQQFLAFAYNNKSTTYAYTHIDYIDANIYTFISTMTDDDDYYL